MDAPKSTTLVLMGDFSLPGKTHSWPRCTRFLKHLDDHFMVQVVRELAWKDTLLDLLLDPLCQQSGFSCEKWRQVAVLATATTK